MKKFGKYSKYIINFIFCVAVIAVYKTFDNLSKITGIFGEIFNALRPFLIGFVIAYIISIPALKLDKLFKKSKNKFLKEHSYGVSVFVSYVSSFIIVFVFLSLMLPALYTNFLDLYTNLPGYVMKMSDMIQNLEIVKKLDLFKNGLDFSQSLTKFLTSIDISQFGKYAQGVFAMTSGVISTFISIISSVYMLLDRERIKKWTLKIMSVIISEEKTENIKKYAVRINEVFVKYLYSRLICSIIMAVVCSTVFAVMKIKYAMILGLFVGIMDMIPYFGSIFASIIAIIITFITGGVWKAVWVSVFLIIAQQLDGNLLSPKIMGDKLDIRPIVIVFAVTVGGSLFGVAGMILSVPIVVILREAVSDFIDIREQRNKEKRDANSDRKDT